jgi:very-short-patch-repair endonuclease
LRGGTWVLLWNQIKQRKINGLDFDQQRVIGNYIADFFFFYTGVVIEIDGYTHDYKLEYDMHRESYLKALGLETIFLAQRQSHPANFTAKRPSPEGN